MATCINGYICFFRTSLKTGTSQGLVGYGYYGALGYLFLSSFLYSCCNLMPCCLRQLRCCSSQLFALRPACRPKRWLRLISSANTDTQTRTTIPKWSHVYNQWGRSSSHDEFPGAKPSDQASDSSTFASFSP